MSAGGEQMPMQSRAAGPLKGMAEVPGDKSVSHRALILGALSVGETRILGLLEGGDVLDTGRFIGGCGVTPQFGGADDLFVRVEHHAAVLLTGDADATNPAFVYAL